MNNETTINQQIHKALGKGCWHMLAYDPYGRQGENYTCTVCHKEGGQNIIPPAYTTSLDLLWPLVEQICEQGYWFELETPSESGRQYCAGFMLQTKDRGIGMFADTAPMAVALACLAMEKV